MALVGGNEGHGVFQGVASQENTKLRQKENSAIGAVNVELHQLHLDLADRQRFELLLGVVQYLDEGCTSHDREELCDGE